jgi:hypothetical protein
MIKSNFPTLNEFFRSLMNTNSEFKKWYSIAGMSIQVEADIPFTDNTFDKKFKKFEIDAPGKDLIRIRHIFSIIPPVIDESWQIVYKKLPWAIYKKDKFWIYLGISAEDHTSDLWTMGIFNESSSEAIICHPDKNQFTHGKNISLTFYPSDQIILARILADRQSFYVHAAGMILHGKGVLFVGHSGAGKSTTVTMLKDDGEILCDDRVIIRHWPEGFRIHGTWSHGDVPEVSNSSAELHAIFFIEQSTKNCVEPIDDRKEINRMLPFYIVKPLVTADWWEKSLDLVAQISREVPVYRLKLDTSGKVKEVLKEFLCGESSDL